MARTKSFNDITNQADRIKGELKRQIRQAKRDGDRERWSQLIDRYGKVLDASDRYTDNIIKQKSDREAVKKANELQRQGRNAESKAIADKANSRQWSQATYMGLNKG